MGVGSRACLAFRRGLLGRVFQQDLGQRIKPLFDQHRRLADIGQRSGAVLVDPLVPVEFLFQLVDLVVIRFARGHQLVHFTPRCVDLFRQRDLLLGIASDTGDDLVPGLAKPVEHIGEDFAHEDHRHIRMILDKGRNELVSFFQGNAPEFELAGEFPRITR